MQLIVVAQADHSRPARLDQGMHRNPSLLEGEEKADTVDVSRVKAPAGV
jgi:hypothetical protein